MLYVVKMMFFFDVFCVLLWFQPGTEDIKLVMFCFDWLTHSVRIGLQVIRLMFFSVFPMLGECYPGGIESRGQRKSGALVIDILQLSPLLAGLLSFLCSSVWTWFIFLSITLFKILEIMPSKWFFQVKFQILSDAFYLMIYARITENVFGKVLFLLPLSPL